MPLSKRLIGLVGRVIANGPRDLGSIPGRVTPKTLKIVLDTSLINTQHYKVRMMGKVEQSMGRSSTPVHLGVVAIEKGAFWSPSITVTNFTYLCHLMYSTVFDFTRAPLVIGYFLCMSSKSNFGRKFCLSIEIFPIFKKDIINIKHMSPDDPILVNRKREGLSELTR